MSTPPTPAEIQHGISLLKETENWEGHVAAVAVDPVCKWNQGGGVKVCGAPVENAIVLLRKNEVERRPTVGDKVEVVVFCRHHTHCMIAAVKRWREMS